jgi:hypothetical protein
MWIKNCLLKKYEMKISFYIDPITSTDTIFFKKIENKIQIMSLFLRKKCLNFGKNCAVKSRYILFWESDIIFRCIWYKVSFFYEKKTFSLQIQIAIVKCKME